LQLLNAHRKSRLNTARNAIAWGVEGTGKTERWCMTSKGGSDYKKLGGKSSPEGAHRGRSAGPEPHER